MMVVSGLLIALVTVTRNKPIQGKKCTEENLSRPDVANFSKDAHLDATVPSSALMR